MCFTVYQWHSLVEGGPEHMPMATPSGIGCCRTCKLINEALIITKFYMERSTQWNKFDCCVSCIIILVVFP